jgi:hypothetical protein
VSEGTSIRKMWILGGTAAVVLAGAGTAYAASSNTQQALAAAKPTPSPTTATSNPTVSQNGNGIDPKAFDVTGNPPSISPGVSKTYMVSVKNNSTQAIHMLTLSGSLASVAGCDTSKITIAPYNANAAGAVQYTIAGRSTATVPMTISFINTNTNQDGCKGKTLSLTYSGTAEQSH